MPNSFLEKKIYLNSYDDIFKACEFALMSLQCSIIKSKGNYFLGRMGFFPYFFGYIIRLYIMNISDQQIEVVINSKSGPLLLFPHHERIIKEIFGKIDQFLNSKGELK